MSARASVGRSDGENIWIMLHLRRHPRSILPRWTIGKPAPTKPPPTGGGGGNGHVQYPPALLGHGLQVVPVTRYFCSQVSYPKYPVHNTSQSGGVREVQAFAMGWNHTPNVLRPFATRAVMEEDTGVYKVIENGTERFVVAGLDPLHKGYVVFDHVTGLVLDQPVRHSVQVAKGVHLDCPGDLRFVDHSCDPNCRLEVVPASGAQEPFLRISVEVPTIQPGEALSIDYNTFELEMSTPFDCRCGAPDCRGKIAGFTRLPTAVRREYFVHQKVSLMTPLVRKWGEANLDTPPRL